MPAMPAIRSLAPASTEKRNCARLQDEDACLLEAFAAGDNRAAQKLIERLSPRVLSQALRLLGTRAEAEDITQEAVAGGSDLASAGQSQHMALSRDGQSLPGPPAGPPKLSTVRRRSG